MSILDGFRKWASGCPPKHFLLYGAFVCLIFSILFTYSFGTSDNWLSVFVKYFIEGYVALIVFWLLWYKLRVSIKGKKNV